LRLCLGDGLVLWRGFLRQRRAADKPSRGGAGRWRGEGQKGGKVRGAGKGVAVPAAGEGALAPSGGRPGGPRGCAPCEQRPGGRCARGLPRPQPGKKDIEGFPTFWWDKDRSFSSAAGLGRVWRFFISVRGPKKKGSNNQKHFQDPSKEQLGRGALERNP